MGQWSHTRTHTRTQTKPITRQLPMLPAAHECEFVNEMRAKWRKKVTKKRKKKKLWQNDVLRIKRKMEKRQVQ